MRLFTASVIACAALVVPPFGLFAAIFALDLRPSTLELVVWGTTSLGLSALAGFLAARYLLRHIRRVLAAMLSIAQGARGVQVPVSGAGELAELSHALNYMSLELKRYDDEQKELLEAVKKGCLETVRALVNAIHARDPYTRGHANRVSRLSVQVAKELGLSGDALLDVEYGGILHDIGKIGIRDHILLKPAQLTAQEMEIMRSHPEHGRRILAGVSFLKPVIPIVLHHHEWWNGKGYPNGLAEEAIPIGARIVAVIDTYDAIVTDRPYQKGRSFEEAKAILERLRGIQFDPSVIDALYVVIARKKAQKLVDEENVEPIAPEADPGTPHELLITEAALAADARIRA